MRSGCVRPRPRSPCVPRGGLAGPRGSATTWWKPSWAVWPITSAASRGSCTPGSSTMIRRSPARARVGSATPERVDASAQHLERPVGGLAVGLHALGVLGLEHDLGAALEVEPEPRGEGERGEQGEADDDEGGEGPPQRCPRAWLRGGGGRWARPDGEGRTAVTRA